MTFHLADVVALFLPGRHKTMISYVAAAAALDDERRGQKPIVGFQVELFLSSGQFQSIVDVVGCVVHLTTTSPTSLSPRRIVVVVRQVMAYQLALLRHFSWDDDLIVAQTTHQIRCIE